MTQLLATGWPTTKTTERRLEFAQSLTELGYAWRRMQEKDTKAVLQLITSTLMPLNTLDQDVGGIVVENQAGELVAALTLYATQFPEVNVVWILHLVVKPTIQGKGVGTVTLGMAEQILPPELHNPVFAGNCAPDLARFYHRAGYAVTQPNELLPLPTNKMLKSSSDERPCWFWRVT